MYRTLKGYVWLTDYVAGPHALHSLHHVSLRPVPPAGVLVPLVAHGHLNVGQHTAGQHRSHAGQAETGANLDILKLQSYPPVVSFNKARSKAVQCVHHMSVT